MIAYYFLIAECFILQLVVGQASTVFAEDVYTGEWRPGTADLGGLSSSMMDADRYTARISLVDGKHLGIEV